MPVLTVTHELPRVGVAIDIGKQAKAVHLRIHSGVKRDLL